jgi:MoaA/NifB/PqqE/SkfB family radical SAM enzyme
MKLENIGFYTLSDKRAKEANEKSPLQRCELLITSRCNFKCPYCRGTTYKGDIPFGKAINYLNIWINEGLKNVRFTGGEPTLHKDLLKMVDYCKNHKVEHIAISTNGSAELNYYKDLIRAGVNDFSISLDGGCCEIGDLMSGGVKGAWNNVIDNIRELSKLTYVSVGMVFTESNINECLESVLFADSLGVGDIRVIPSAQFNQALIKLQELPQNILSKYKILKYRINNLKQGRHVRGLKESDYNKCPLSLDDMAVASGYHFPCVIYMREQGEPIGRLTSNVRQDRKTWFENHNTFKDKICKENCLDVCIDYNNKWREYHAIH